MLSLRSLFRATLVLGALFIAAPATAQVDDEERKEIEKVIREYLLTHPEVIRDAIFELQRREQAAQEEATAEAIKANRPALLDSRAPRIGPDDAEIQIIKFLDYNCSVCRVSAAWVQEMMEAYPGQIQFVIRDYAALEARTGSSIEAAIASHAAIRQDRYEDFHFALMQADSNLNSRMIDDIARETGLNVTRLRDDMEAININGLLSETAVLANRLGVNGTPYFVVGDELVRGFNQFQLEELIEEAVATDG